MSGLHDFFADLDGSWPPAVQRVTLHLLGSTALMLQTEYARSTKDSDVLETAELTGPIKQQLLAVAGRGSELHHRHRVYLDIVGSALPFLPQQPVWHPVILAARPRHFDVVALDVVDVVVSKLARLSDDDLADIDAMVAARRVPHARLIERFARAVDWAAYDAQAFKLPSYVERLHRIERDIFGVHETAIELPDVGY